MRLTKAILGGLGLALSTGCFHTMSLSQGARQAFEKSFFCPGPQVTVAARPDVPVHTIVQTKGDGAQPPPEVAADPARLQMWQQAQAQKSADVDSLGPPYEVVGCGEKVMLVCFHPTYSDIASGRGVVVGDTSTSISNGDDNSAQYLSAVACISASKGKLGLGFKFLKVLLVEAGGPAQKAGFAVGDTITAIDGQTVTSDLQVMHRLRATDPATHTVTVLRGGATKELTVPSVGP